MADRVNEIQLEKRLPRSNDPSLPSTAPRKPFSQDSLLQHEEPKKRLADYIYNKETGEYLGRTCLSWIKIITYAIIYLMFLTTFTLIVLYTSLTVLKKFVEFKRIDELTYPEGGIGLTAIPTSEYSYPLIWYKHGENDDFRKYVQTIERLLRSNSKENDSSSLGPCGEYPYGYGDSPCVIIKVNKYFQWAGQPLQLNSTAINSAPPEVLKWMSVHQNKLWLQCNGYHSYDKEHIGKIKYYPDPPGFDASSFPLDADSKSPLVAIQISGFTIGISLAIECKLWYEKGPSSVEFVIYVAPGDSIFFAGHNSVNV